MSRAGAEKPEGVVVNRRVDALKGKARARALEVLPMLLATGLAGQVELWLELELELVGGAMNGRTITMAVLMDACDPYELAGELAGIADEVVKQVGRDRGLDEQEQRELVRRQRIREKARRAEVAEAVAASGATHCDFCQRSVAFVVEGAKLCKRHAEELGVRPHGKVGEPEEQPDLWPGEPGGGGVLQ